MTYFHKKVGKNLIIFSDKNHKISRGAMVKLKALLNKKRPHFTKRVKLRRGKLRWIWYFLLSKQVDNFQNKSNKNSQVYKYKKIIFFVNEGTLQTYIDKRITKQEEKLARKINK
jgi:MFS superfamily sulfate permease-like transporter